MMGGGGDFGICVALLSEGPNEESIVEVRRVLDRRVMPMVISLRTVSVALVALSGWRPPRSMGRRI